MSAESSIEKALSHRMVQDAITDTIKTISEGQLQEEQARVIVNEFATKVLGYALTRPVQPPHLTSKDWKKQWGIESLGVLLLSDKNLFIEYSHRIFTSGYNRLEIFDILGQLATVLSATVRMIHCGLNPELLRD